MIKRIVAVLAAVALTFGGAAIVAPPAAAAVLVCNSINSQAPLTVNTAKGGYRTLHVGWCVSAADHGNIRGIVVPSNRVAVSGGRCYKSGYHSLGLYDAKTFNVRYRC